jgi:hypothetical protein
VAGPGQRSRAWQGSLAGGTITVVPAELIWRGALSRNVEKALGRKVVLMAVALDNRKGRRMLRFRPKNSTLRALNSEAVQVDMLDLAAMLKSGNGRAAGKLGAKAARVDCLPGAYQCLVLALPAGTDVNRLSRLFWVQGPGEPAELGPIWLSAEESTELRKSLR